MVLPPTWQTHAGMKAEAELRVLMRKALMSMDMRANSMLMVTLAWEGYPYSYLATLSMEEEAKLPPSVREYWEHECDDPVCLARGHGRI